MVVHVTDPELPTIRLAPSDEQRYRSCSAPAAPFPGIGKTLASDLQLRQIGLEHAEAAAALIRVAFAAQPVATRPPSSALKETTASIAAWLGAGGGFGMSEGPDLVALLLWDERDRGLYCGRLAVCPAFRGKGLARRLIAEAEREARRRELPHMHARVRLELPDNLRLFESCGFVETGRDAHAGFATPTIVRLEKRLVDRAS